MKILEFLTNIINNKKSLIRLSFLKCEGRHENRIPEKMEGQNPKQWIEEAT